MEFYTPLHIWGQGRTKAFPEGVRKKTVVTPLRTPFWKNIDTFLTIRSYTHFHITSVNKLFIVIFWCKLQGMKNRDGNVSKNIYIFIHIAL